MSDINDLLISRASLKRRNLKDLDRLRAAVGQYSSATDLWWAGASKDMKCQELERAAQRYWDEKHATAVTKQAGRSTRRCDVFPSGWLTASECNAFLRTLPPFPLWGE